MSTALNLVFSAVIAAVPIFAMCGQAVSAVSDEGWRTLEVADLGTRVQYPASIFSVPDGKPEKGIGERLSTSDGRATFEVYSFANESNETPAGYLNRYLRTPRAQLDYHRVTPSFFAISTVRDDTIYLCNFSRFGTPAIHCVDLVYPAREERAWDAIVTRISLSLRPLQKQ